MRNGWGLIGIVLGGWEAAAVATRWVPTVSATVCRCRGRWWWTDAVVVLWAAGTVRHLMTYKEGL